MATTHPRASRIGRLLARSARWWGDLFRKDLTDTPWGHRIMDQIFREGKFSERHSAKKRGTGRKRPGETC